MPFTQIHQPFTLFCECGRYTCCISSRLFFFFFEASEESVADVRPRMSQILFPRTRASFHSRNAVTKMGKFTITPVLFSDPRCVCGFRQLSQ